MMVTEVEKGPYLYESVYWNPKNFQVLLCSFLYPLSASIRDCIAQRKNYYCV